MDVRRQTALIIAKDGGFLVGFSLFLRFSKSPYDAWRTRKVEAARMVADRIGGELMLFNPIVGQLRRYERKMKNAEHR